MRNLHAQQDRAAARGLRPEPLDVIERVPGEARRRRAHRVALREMEEALAQLGGEQREVVLMVALTGMSYKTARGPGGADWHGDVAPGARPRALAADAGGRDAGQGRAAARRVK